jgi:hypothetical protein
MANPNTAIFPGAAATDADLFVATDQAVSTLSAAMTNVQTTVHLASATRFVAPCLITIGSEIIVCPTDAVANVFSGVTRGAMGTAAAAHASGATASGLFAAWHHNQLAAEVKAVETALKTGPLTLAGLVGIGASGNAAGLHIMGDGAFGSDVGGALLWLDQDTQSPYGFAITNRIAGTAHFAGISVGNSGQFSLDVDGANAGFFYEVADTSFSFYGSKVLTVNSLATGALTVATLPAPPAAGQRAFVTDSNAASFTLGIGAVVAAGGATAVPVVYDGTNWRIG